MSKIYGWDDLDISSRELIEMPKDIFGGNYSHRWPQPGNKLSIELIAQEDRSIKFFLDLEESRRSTSLSISLVSDRKAKMQTRNSSFPIIRVDYADIPELLRHTNPDGSVITGPHVHLDLDGRAGLRWAVPIEHQTVLSVPQVINIPSLFWSFEETCHITRQLKVEQSLGV